MKVIHESVTTQGRITQSDYVVNSMGAEKRDRFLEHVFPLGGHPATQGGPPYRRKFFETYHYSDPLKVGR